MYAVVGVWEMDPGLREQQTSALERIVPGVAQLPGLVKGYWSDSSHPNRSHTFIVFSERDAAEAFASDVRANLQNQAEAGVRNIELDLATIKATT